MYAAILTLIWSINGPNGGSGGSAIEVEVFDTEAQCQIVVDAFYLDSKVTGDDMDKRLMQDFNVIRKSRCVKLDDS